MSRPSDPWFAVRRNYTRFREEIQTNEFVVHAYSYGLLSRSHVNEIRRSRNTHESNARLLDILLKGSEESFRVFVQLLTDSGHDDELVALLHEHVRNASPSRPAVRPTDNQDESSPGVADSRAAYENGVGRPNVDITIPFARAVVIGESQSGKSSLTSSLCGEAIPTDADNSTIGIEATTAISRRGDSKAAWQTQSLSTELVKIIAGRGSESASRSLLHRQASIALGAQDSELEAEGRSSHVFRSALRRVTEKGYCKLQDGHLSIDTSIHVFRLWDTAGQHAYQLMQRSFYSSYRTSYLIVYNAGHAVDAIAPVEKVKEVGTAREVPTPGSRQDSLYYIHEAMQSVSHLPESQACRVFIVGCRKDCNSDDNTPGYWEGQTSRILKSLKGKGFASLLKKEKDIVFVDNKHNGMHDVGVVYLREQLMEESMCHTGIPLARLLETLVLLETADTGDIALPWVRLDDLRELAISLGNVTESNEDDFKAMLQFHQGMGNILGFEHCEELRHKVVINVPGLLQAAGALIVPKLELNDYPLSDRDDYHLYYCGFVTDSMAKTLWEKRSSPKQACRFRKLVGNPVEREYFVKLMDEMCLLADAGAIRLKSGKEKRIFLMPSVACSATNDYACWSDDDDKDEDTKLFSKVYITSAAGHHFPRPLWLFIGTKVIQRHNQLRPQSTVWSETVLSSQHMKLPWNSSKEQWLHLYYSRCGISLSMEVECRSVAQLDPDLGTAVLSQIMEWFDNSKLVHATMELHTSVKCCCDSSIPGSSTVCAAHGDVSCRQRAGCFHLVDQVQAGESPRCPATFPRKKKELDGEALEAIGFWLNLKQGTRDSKFVLAEKFSGSVAGGSGNNITPLPSIAVLEGRLQHHERLGTPMPDNPWQSQRFIDEFYSWVLSLPANTLRRSAAKACMLSSLMVRELEGLNSNWEAHNTCFMQHVSPGGVHKFLPFIRTIHGMGYHSQAERLKHLLPDCLLVSEPQTCM
ncbi:uncharacterized protein LOC135811626 [Sycon ciliatum]|uniref:uncharacterized protein LOC135811626 n=1 Tax=Sycon ciliatum TaxID=27933 RepID=UPI0031F71008